MKFLKIFILKIINRLHLVRGDVNKNDRQGGIFKSWGYVFTNHLQGEYVEFGVYRGEGAVSSLKSYQNFYNWLNSQKKSSESWRRDVAFSSPLNQKPGFHLLDTFEGMPENNEDITTFRTGSFQSNYDEVRSLIKKNNNINLDIFFYKGLFKENSSLLKKSLHGKKIAILNIDCDLKSSTIDALEIIKDFLQIGTIILFDDYNQFNANNEKGQRKAFNDFKNYNQYQFEKFYTYGFAGQSFLIVGYKK